MSQGTGEVSRELHKQGWEHLVADMATIQTPVPCISLRSFRPTDEPALVRHGDSAAVAHFLRERFPHPYTANDAR